MSEFQEVKTDPESWAQRFSPKEKHPLKKGRLREAQISARIIPEIQQASEWAKKGFISQEAFQNYLVRSRINAEIRAKKQSERAQNAYIDVLTGLPNRNAFEERFEKMVHQNQKKGKPVFLMFIDNKGLKSVNAEISQEAGDSFLAVTGQLFKTAVGKHGQVYRYGGDEWVVLGVGNQEKGKKVWEGIDVLSRPPQEIEYMKEDGTTGSFKKEIRFRGTIAEVSPDNPFLSLAQAKIRLNEAKDAHKNINGNLLLETIG